MSRTSEWVSLGHPDKVADYISEYILDRYLEVDSATRYALEVMIKNNDVFLGGEITSQFKLDDEQIEMFVKSAISSIGYNKDYNRVWGDNAIDINKVKVTSLISQQSPNISDGVDNKGWGDQGIFFGYAENNPKTNYMPADIFYAKSIGTQLYNKVLKMPYKSLGLDIKTQVTVDDEDKITKVIVAVPCLGYTEKVLAEQLVREMVEKLPHTPKYELTINGTGTYIIHSSIGDCGITGRKLAVDFYGGNCPIGGGSPWTKDGTKADLSLNLLMRDYALDEIKAQNNPYIHHIIASTNSCIGQSYCDIKFEFFDKNNYKLNTIETQKILYPEKIIEIYKLNTPKFAYMCKNGLFEK